MQWISKTEDNKAFVLHVWRHTLFENPYKTTADPSFFSKGIWVASSCWAKQTRKKRKVFKSEELRKASKTATAYKEHAYSITQLSIIG